MKHALIPKEWGETLELDTEGGEPEEYVEERQRLLLSDLLPPNWRKQSNMVLPSKLTTHITDFFDKPRGAFMIKTRENYGLFPK